MPRAPEKGRMDRSPFFMKKQQEREEIAKARQAKDDERAEITGDGTQPPAFTSGETRAVPKRMPPPPPTKKAGAKK